MNSGSRFESGAWDSGRGREYVERLYGGDPDTIGRQIDRYERLCREFESRFDREAACVFSAPGRTELGGNHTDHNHGLVLAASVNLDSIAAAAASSDGRIVVHSEGYPEAFVVDLDQLAPVAAERGTTTALVRGTASRLKELGYHVGGFRACVTSDVLPGSGLSSSASIEVLLGLIFSTLHNDGRIDPETVAKAGQFAENEFFGKPCGLMDQMASAIGGIVSIDFKRPEAPLVSRVEYDFSREGFCLLFVDTGGSHVDLTDDYASVPEEMTSVARVLGRDVCRGISREDIVEHMALIRGRVGDRAVLRGLHFFAENQRVVRQVEALSSGRFDEYLELVRQSGSSSWRWLQNCYSSQNVSEQGVTLALALTEEFLSGGPGAFRVHGGGFAGAIQVYLPEEMLKSYIALMEPVFEKGCVAALSVRQAGATHLSL